jgi:hypothetical protein
MVKTILCKLLWVGPFLLLASICWNGVYAWLGEAGNNLTERNFVSAQSFEMLRLSLAVGWLALGWLWVISMGWIFVGTYRKHRTGSI